MSPRPSSIPSRRPERRRGDGRLLMRTGAGARATSVDRRADISRAGRGRPRGCSRRRSRSSATRLPKRSRRFYEDEPPERVRRTSRRRCARCVRPLPAGSAATREYASIPRANSASRSTCCRRSLRDGTTPSRIESASAMPRRRALLRYGAASLAVAGIRTRRRRVAGPPVAARRCVPPSFRRLTFRRGLIRSARLAPDGQTIFYSALWEGDRCRVHTVRVDSPESSAERSARWERAGDLAIRRAGAGARIALRRASSPTARWHACRWPVVRRARWSRT